MGYQGIFPTDNLFPDIIYPILSIMFCVLLYYALFNHTLQKIIEQLYFTASHFEHTQRSIIYLFIINFPCIVLGVSSIVHNRSLAGMEISFNIDQIQIFILTAYICHLEESRQTPIRGFLFIRDIIVLIGFFGCLSKIYFDGLISIEYGLILLGLYFIYYIILLVEVRMEESVLEICGLKESTAFNSKFLFSQERNQGNYLLIKEIIQTHEQLIEEQIQQIKYLVTRVQVDTDHQQIMINLAKLLIPFKKAFDILQSNEISEMISTINDEWEIQSNTPEDDQEHQIINEMSNNSITQLRNMKTMTEEDYVEEKQEEKEQQLIIDVIAKYAFYPIYLFSLAQGRLHYVFSYLSFFMLVGSMWLISNSSSYLIYRSEGIGFTIITVVLSVLLVYPKCKYFIKISSYHDYDFLNLFIQSCIMKSVIFGICITITHFAFPGSMVEGNIGYLLIMICRIFTLIVFTAFMISNKFATHNDNIIFITGLTVSSHGVRVVLQAILQSTLI